MAMKDDGLGEYETCSLCVSLVLWRSMTETQSGNVCLDCYADIRGW